MGAPSFESVDVGVTPPGAVSFIVGAAIIAGVPAGVASVGALTIALSEPLLEQAVAISIEPNETMNGFANDDWAMSKLLVRVKIARHPTRDWLSHLHMSSVKTLENPRRATVGIMLLYLLPLVRRARVGHSSGSIAAFLLPVAVRVKHVTVAVSPLQRASTQTDLRRDAIPPSASISAK